MQTSIQNIDILKGQKDLIFKVHRLYDTPSWVLDRNINFNNHSKDVHILYLFLYSIFNCGQNLWLNYGADFEIG